MNISESISNTSSALRSGIQQMTSDERIQHICDVIRAEEKRLREKYPFLRFQNAIGLGIMFVSLAGMIGSGWLYYIGAIPAWLCIVVNAIFASLSHELEHDLIHHQYFRNQRPVQNFMMLVVWIMRPNTVNPWYRREIHFLHHKRSGTQQDLEERLVGNGISKALLRYIVMFDGFIGLFVRRKVLEREVTQQHF